MADTDEKRTLEKLIDEIADCAVFVGKSEAMKGFGAFTEIDSISMTAMRRSISQKRAQILGHFDATATPPADAALADECDAAAGTFCGNHVQSAALRKAAAALRARAVPEGCKHENRTSNYDHLICNQCGAFMTDSQWGSVSNRWFPSKEAAILSAADDEVKNGSL